MSKVVKTTYEMVQLSDTPQVAPFPPGYSPALPTAPGVTPANTSGITVKDSYSADTVASLNNSYGVVNINQTIQPGGNIATLYLNIPAGATLQVFNYSTYANGTQAQVAITTLSTSSNLFYCPYGAVCTIPGNYWFGSANGTSSNAVYVTDTTITQITSNTSGVVFSYQVQVFWYF